MPASGAAAIHVSRKQKDLQAQGFALGDPASSIHPPPLIRWKGILPTHRTRLFAMSLLHSLTATLPSTHLHNVCKWKEQLHTGFLCHRRCVSAPKSLKTFMRRVTLSDSSVDNSNRWHHSLLFIFVVVAAHNLSSGLRRRTHPSVSPLFPPTPPMKQTSYSAYLFVQSWLRPKPIPGTAWSPITLFLQGCS
jgi:hypothetical protein